jgi:hypothetical protein
MSNQKHTTSTLQHTQYYCTYLRHIQQYLSNHCKYCSWPACYLTVLTPSRVSSRVPSSPILSSLSTTVPLLLLQGGGRGFKMLMVGGQPTNLAGVPPPPPNLSRVIGRGGGGISSRNYERVRGTDRRGTVTCYG